MNAFDDKIEKLNVNCFAIRTYSDQCGWQDHISSLSMNNIDVFDDEIKQ